MSSNTVFIAAGGTGGHIFPALALAEAVSQSYPEAKILFFGAKGKMEERLVPQHGFALKTVPIGRLNRNVSLMERVLTLLQLPYALLKCFFWVLKERPRWILGVGGYASGPILLAGALLRRPTFIWEPNAYPGMANRILSRFVDEALVVFESAVSRLKNTKWHRVGLPVRGDIEKIPDIEVETGRKLRVLIMGGSQGARPINNVVRDSAIAQPDRCQSFEWRHQCGRLDAEALKQAYHEHNIHFIQLEPFIDDVAAAYEWADVVICRCGTGTLSELAASGRPGLMIPLPSAADNHQQKNAEAIEALGGGKMMLQKDLSCEALLSWLERIPKDELQAMGRNIRGFHQKHAAQAMADLLMGKTKI